MSFAYVGVEEDVMGAVQLVVLIVFAFGLVGKFLDRTSTGASGEDGIYLSLCSLEGQPFVIIRDHVVIIVNSKLISMHISNIMFWVLL